MNAIVVVFMPGHDGQLLTEQASPLRVVDLTQQATGSDNTRTSLRQISNRVQTTPPLWTWFIENPRTCGV